VSPLSPRRVSLAGAVARALLPAAVLAASGLSGRVPSAQAAGPIAVPDKAKHRVVVMTDIGGDPDDQQSLVRFLLYSCDFDVEGLCTGFGWGHDRNTRPDLIHAAIDAYGKVLSNLRLHRSDYPAYERLKALVKDGHNGDPHKVGPGMDSEASEWIIEVLKRDDPRPVWFTIWGGPRELAQALWKLEKTVPPQELARLKKKIRVHSIADQDRTAGWVKTHHPDVFWIYSDGLFRGIWKEGDQEIVSPAWLEANVRTGHGPLGPLYPAKAAGKDGVKEGDTPSFFYVLPDGLSDPEHPEWGNWGGRFRRSGRGNEYIPAEDLRNGRPDVLYTIHRWRTAYQNAFEARMDWCVKPFDEANHEPAAGLGGDTTRRVLQVRAEPGTQVKLSAAGSSDPDGDALAYRWWVYREPGSYWAAPPIQHADRPEATLTVPADAAGRTIHVILEVTDSPRRKGTVPFSRRENRDSPRVTDSGKPPLTAYRRLILKVSGQPVVPPPGVPLADEDLTEPVTRLEGPPANTGPWRFYRGINIGGPAVEIDGNRWEGDDAANFTCTDAKLESPNVPLRPPTDPARAKMIRAFRWAREAKLELAGVPRGTYAVCAYVWEETRSTTFTVRLNGRVVQQDYRSGPAGRWRRLGPWTTTVEDGKITVTAAGGDANFSGLEVWCRTKQ